MNYGDHILHCFGDITTCRKRGFYPSHLSPWNYFPTVSFSMHVITIHQRYRRADRQTEDMPYQYRALRS